MASYRRRGAHAARPVTAPFVAVKHAPENGANGSAPVTDGIPGGGRRSVRGISLTGFAPDRRCQGDRGGARGRRSGPVVRRRAVVHAVGRATVEAFLLAWQEKQYQAAAQLTTGNPAEVAAHAAGRLPPARRGRASTCRWGRSASTGTRPGPSSMPRWTSARTARRGTTTAGSTCARRQRAGGWCGRHG